MSRGKPRQSHEVPKLKAIELEGDSVDIDYFLKHEFVDIFEPCQTLPAIIEWINSHMQFYHQERIALKQDAKKAEARAYFDLRNGIFEERGYGKLTEAALGHAICLEESVIEAHDNYAGACSWAKRLENLMVSMQLRLDMLRSSEATRRKLVEPITD